MLRLSLPDLIYLEIQAERDSQMAESSPLLDQFDQLDQFVIPKSYGVLAPLHFRRLSPDLADRSCPVYALRWLRNEVLSIIAVFPEEMIDGINADR